MPDAGNDIPLSVRLQLAHAALQVVANRVGSDLLHIKGEALEPRVRWEGRASTDVDVLVRPDHVAGYVDALLAAGWTQVSSFAGGSAFEHSATLTHSAWGYADVHRIYPGLGRDAGAAFEHLWAARQVWLSAGIPCPVPDLTGQRLVLLLHAGRSPRSSRTDRDIAVAWADLLPEEQDEVRALAQRVHAQVGLAAATGTLDEWMDDPQYDLWNVVSTGGTRIDEWRARVKAAPTLRAKARLVARAPLVNAEHLTIVRGAPPSRWDVVVEFFARPVRGLREEWARRRR